MRETTSRARSPSRTALAMALRASARSGSGRSSQRCAASAWLSTAASGEFTSCAIEAVSVPMVVMREARAISVSICASRACAAL